MKYGLVAVLIVLGLQGVEFSRASSDELDEFLGESYEAGSLREENKLIDQLTSISINFLQKNYPTGFVPRDVHAKSHGCLFGNMHVDNRNLPASLRTGIFADNKDHPIVLRYSSNDKDRKLEDMKQDIRGLGIKVMNVNDTLGESQDFLFLAHEAFFIKTNAFYVEFLTRLLSNRLDALLWLARNDFSSAMNIARDMINTAKNYDNPLDIPFFSAVPFRLGGAENPHRRAVKYRVTRVDCDQKTLPLTPARRGSRRQRDQDPNFLRNHLSDTMSRGEACLALAIQVRSSADQKSNPVEDSSIAWTAPYREVAKISLPAQEFNTPEMNLFCENLSFDPWRTLPEHRPLGRINRARRKIYSAIAKYRHTRNGIMDTYREPTDFTVIRYPQNGK